MACHTYKVKFLYDFHINKSQKIVSFIDIMNLWRVGLGANVCRTDCASLAHIQTLWSGKVFSFVPSSNLCGPKNGHTWITHREQIRGCLCFNDGKHQLEHHNTLKLNPIGFKTLSSTEVKQSLVRSIPFFLKTLTKEQSQRCSIPKQITVFLFNVTPCMKWKKSQANYLGGIRPHNPCNS